MEDKRGVALVDPGLPGPKTSRMLRERLKQAEAVCWDDDYSRQRLAAVRAVS